VFSLKQLFFNIQMNCKILCNFKNHLIIIILRCGKIILKEKSLKVQNDQLTKQIGHHHHISDKLDNILDKLYYH